MGTVATEQAGLAYFSKAQVVKAQGKEGCHLIQEEVQADVEEERMSKMVGMRQQGRRRRWENSAAHGLLV